MKTFMLGWEFPPFISGGLGTACYGLTKAMSKLGTEIVFVLPKSSQTSYSSHVKLLSAEGNVETKELSEFKNVRFQTIISPLKPYVSSETYGTSNKRKSSNHTRSWHCNPSKNPQNYGCDIYEQVHRYAQKAVEIASVEDFDIIHAHDWMTYPAGTAIAQSSAKPLIVHVHSTEFDRSGERINQTIYDIERDGMHHASKIIAVSNYTKNIIVNR
jgi:glycogen(starch) synthase